MKKLMILAAALLMVGSAFAAPAMNAGRLFVQPNATFAAGSPLSTNNDDSCDIAVTPAATLLLPYFEVDYQSPSNAAVNTLFAITNTSRIPQIAHITVWTDWSFPVLDFNIYLTGYDVQTINLYDIISRGVIPATGWAISNEGPLSFGVSVDAAGNVIDLGNPNFLPSAIPTCAELPGPIPGTLLASIQSALTTGVYSGCAGLVGGTHTNAIGYVTVDVAATCTQALPTDTAYFSQEILFDNVLIGDYFRINPTSTTGNFAGGNPMVHIRAVPEGGPAGAGAVATNLPFTFYDRYTPATAREIDRRQPLPSVFAARYIDRTTATDDMNFGTRMAMWREGVIRDVGTSPTCALISTTHSRSQYGNNRNMSIQRLVRFDEQENPTLPGGCQISPCPAETSFTAPETSAPSVTDTTRFPADFTGTDDAGGWMYLNLSNPTAVSTTPLPNERVLTDRGTFQTTQNWVVIEMTAEGRYGLDYDAAYLGNGCSPNPGASSVIGPLPNTTVLTDAVQ